METNNHYYQTFMGAFSGILRWHQLDELWNVLKTEKVDDWYIYAVGDTPPKNPTPYNELEKFITEVDKLLRTEHAEDYCGIVYVDNKTQPKFIKIFDPNNLGTSCSTGMAPPLPAWILSKQAPIDLPSALPQANNRRRWWKNIFKRN